MPSPFSFHAPVPSRQAPSQGSVSSGRALPSARRPRGTSVVETLVALALLLIVAIFVFNLFVSTRKGVHLSENRANAASLGRSLLDDVRRGGFDSAVTGSGTYTFAGSNDGNAASVQVAWTRTVQVTEANRKLVWIMLSWHETTGDKKVVLETILQK